MEELLFSEDHNYIVINVFCSEKALASCYIYSWSLCQCLLSLKGNFTLFAHIKSHRAVPGEYVPKKLGRADQQYVFGTEGGRSWGKLFLSIAAFAKKKE